MHIGDTFLHLLLPGELSFYLSERHPGLCTFLGLLILPFAMFWMLFWIMIPAEIKEFKRLAREAPHVNVGEEIMLYCLFLLGPIVLIIIVRLLFHFFWKPSEEILSFNERATAAHIARIEAEERKAREAQQESQQAPQEVHWDCPACGKSNSMMRRSCWSCDTPRADD